MKNYTKVRLISNGAAAFFSMTPKFTAPYKDTIVKISYLNGSRTARSIESQTGSLFHTMPRITRLLSILIAALLLTGLLHAPARAADKKLVLIISDQITLKELNDPGVFRSFHNAVKDGALGLMVTQPPAGFDPSGGYATLGAGRAVQGSPLAGEAFNIGETPPEGQTVVSTYITRMAEKPPVDRIDILHLGLPELQRANGGTDAGLGGLGEALWKSHVTTCVFGNADFRGAPHREAALIGMNARGQVERGDVAWTRLRKIEAQPPFEATADMALLKDTFYDEILHNFDDPDTEDLCDFIIIDLGDTRRAEMFRETAAPDVADSRKLEALGRLDQFLGFVLNAVDRKTTQVLLVSPSAPVDNFMQDETMTPVLAVGAGIEHGLLSSPSTRRKGLIRNTDIAPHILNYFGVPAPAHMAGAPLSTAKNGNAVAKLLRLQYLDAMRLRVVRVGHAAVVLAFAMIALAFLTVMRMPRVGREWLVTQGVSLSLAAALFPALLFAALAFMNLFGDQPGGFLHYVALIAGFTLAAGLGVALIPRAEWRVLAIAGIYITGIIADACLGFVLSRNSVLVPSPQFGQRFYGMDNVLAGLLIGGGLVAAGLGMDLLRERAQKARWAVLPVLAAITAVIGLPVLGANYGALLPACAAFTVFCVVLFRKRFRWAEALFSAALGIVLFVGLAAACALVAGGAWPGARTMALLQQAGGLHEFTRLLVWRAAANLSVFRSGGVWSMLLFAVGVCSAMLVFFPNSRAEALFRRFTHTRFALLAALAGAAVSFMLLAGGVAPAAAILFLPALGALTLSVTPVKKARRSGKGEKDKKPLSLFSKKQPKETQKEAPAEKTGKEDRKPQQQDSSSIPGKSERARKPGSSGDRSGQAPDKDKKPRRRRPPRSNRPEGKPLDGVKPSGEKDSPGKSPGGNNPSGKKRKPPRNNLPRQNKPRGGGPGGSGGGNKPGGGPGGGNKPGGGPSGGNKPGGGSNGGNKP